MKPWQERSDDELVADGLAGSEPALVALYERYRPRIIGFVARMTADRDLAEEVFAATFVRFFENLDRYRPRGSLGAYLLKIARSRLVEERKARDRLHPSADGRQATDPPRAVPAEGPPPDRAVADAELQARARQALEVLPDPLREVIILRLYEGLAYADIAEIVGAGEATVRSRMRYALLALRQMLPADTVDD